MWRFGAEQTISLAEMVTELETPIQQSDLFCPIFLKSEFKLHRIFREMQTSEFSEKL